jgi:hypothetical protein
MFSLDDLSLKYSLIIAIFERGVKGGKYWR